MLKLIKFILWVVVILALTIGFDRLMFSVTFTSPGLEQTQKFYVDFRTRLFALMQDNAIKTDSPIESLITDKREKNGSRKTKATRYLYVDGHGELQFADSLEEVPQRFRDKAQPLAE